MISADPFANATTRCGAGFSVASSAIDCALVMVTTDSALTPHPVKAKSEAAITAVAFTEKRMGGFWQDFTEHVH